MGKHIDKSPEYSYGFRGRMDERYDMVRTVFDGRYVYIRNYMPHKIYGQFISYMFKTPTTRIWHEMHKSGKLNDAQSKFWQTKPAEELYDLNNDRDEIINLAKSKEHENIIKSLRRAHVKWVKDVRDIGFLPEAEVHSRSKKDSPYEMGHDSNRYDLDNIFQAANIATRLGKKNTEKLQKLKESNVSAVRYWGAMGYLIRGKSGLRKGRKFLVNALKDESPSVRIIAAESLGRYGNKKESKLAADLLIKYADPKENGISLSMLSLNAIDYLDEKASHHKETISKLPKLDPNADPRTRNYAGNLIGKIMSDLK